jgi:hypothetical protein
MPVLAACNLEGNPIEHLDTGMTFTLTQFNLKSASEMVTENWRHHEQVKNLLVVRRRYAREGGGGRCCGDGVDGLSVAAQLRLNAVVCCVAFHSWPRALSLRSQSNRPSPL